MSIAFYHGNEEWILKGLGVDLHKLLHRSTRIIHHSGLNPSQPMLQIQISTFMFSRVS